VTPHAVLFPWANGLWPGRRLVPGPPVFGLARVSDDEDTVYANWNVLLASVFSTAQTLVSSRNRVRLPSLVPRRKSRSLAFQHGRALPTRYRHASPSPEPRNSRCPGWSMSSYSSEHQTPSEVAPRDERGGSATLSTQTCGSRTNRETRVLDTSFRKIFGSLAVACFFHRVWTDRLPDCRRKEIRSEVRRFPHILLRRGMVSYLW